MKVKRAIVSVSDKTGSSSSPAAWSSSTSS